MTTIFLDKERITNDDLLAVVCLTLGLFLLVKMILFLWILIKRIPRSSASGSFIFSGALSQSAQFLVLPYPLPVFDRMQAGRQFCRLSAPAKCPACRDRQQ